MRRYLLAGVLTTITIMATSLTSCATRPSMLKQEPAGNGTLVIVGGGLQRDNAAVYTRILELTNGGRIGILPTASGVPEEVGPEYVEDFDKFSEPGRSLLIDIPYNRPEEAQNPERVVEIESVGGLFFTGGDQSRIIRAFRPEDGDVAGYDATLAVLNRGGVIAGSSAGAAMMSDPMIRWGNSAEALLAGVSDVEDRGVAIGRGMGYFPYGLTDQHFLRRGRFGRLIVAMEHAEETLGFGVADNAALVADLQRNQLEVIGDHGVLIIDSRLAGSSENGRRNLRLSLLGTGDLVEVYRRRGESFFYVTPTRTSFPLSIDGRQEVLEKSAWDTDALCDAVRLLSTPGVGSVLLPEENFNIILSVDRKSAGYRSDSSDQTPTLVNMRLDITPKEIAEETLLTLRKELTAPTE